MFRKLVKFLVASVW